MLEFYRKTMHRILLEKELAKACKNLKGNIIDVGSGNRRYDYMLPAKPLAVDIKPNDELQIVYGNLETGLEYKDNSFDGILCIEVLEYLSDQEKAIRELKRILKPGGEAIITMPLTYPDHGDKCRLTFGYLKEILQRNFSDYQIKKLGNGFTLLWDIVRLKLFRSKLGKPARLFLVFFIPYLIVVLLFGLHKKDDEFYTGLFIRVKKDL